MRSFLHESHHRLQIRLRKLVTSSRCPETSLNPIQVRFVVRTPICFVFFRSSMTLLQSYRTFSKMNRKSHFQFGKGTTSNFSQKLSNLMVTTSVTLKIGPQVREEGLQIFNSLEFCIAANVNVILYSHSN